MTALVIIYEDGTRQAWTEADAHSIPWPIVGAYHQSSANPRPIRIVEVVHANTGHPASPTPSVHTQAISALNDLSDALGQMTFTDPRSVDPRNVRNHVARHMLEALMAIIAGNERYTDPVAAVARARTAGKGYWR